MIRLVTHERTSGTRELDPEVPLTDAHRPPA